jgi:hypothetical protein
MFMIWQTSTGWHFTDCFFHTQEKVGPYRSEADARSAAYGRMAWHGFKLMFT